MRLAPRSVVLGVSAVTVAALTATGVAAGTATATARAGAAVRSVDPGDATPFLGGKPAISDIDVRGFVAPTRAIRRAVHGIGPSVQVSYNRFGTPSALTSSSGWLATGLRGNAVHAARAWLSTHRTAFGLTAADMAALQLVNDQRLAHSTAHAVLFRQSFSGYHAGNDGLVTVGIRHGNVASVTSTLVGGQRLNRTRPALSPLQAVVAAAHDDGRTSLRLADLHLARRDHTTFTNVAAKGFAQVQRTRLVALPTDQGARLTYETDISDVRGGRALATISFVDAVTGKVLVRHNVVDTLSQGAGVPQAAMVSQQAAVPQLGTPSRGTRAGGAPGTFSGSFTATKCSPRIPLTVAAGAKSVQVVVNADNAEDDIALNVYENGQSIGSSDEATTPEAVSANLPNASTSSDTFAAEVCPSAAPLGPFLPPYTFQGVYSASSSAVSPEQANTPYPPIWKYFPDSPALGHDKDTRTTTCWTRDSSDPSVTKSVKGCRQTAQNPYSRAPWDVAQGVPTFTSVGNNANEAEAWYGSTLTPGEFYHPVSTSRDYTFPFTDQWFTSNCSPTVFASPQRNDIDAVITNLFVGHNVVHDFSYRLGYTERNYNNQSENYGLTAPSQQNDPEIGDVQSGAVTNEPIAVANGAAGGTVPVTGRDNANQIPLQDGVPGITNQYLFQPVVGFYGPCHDGDFDMSVYGHEYTHEISNRMIAGPDTGLSGTQGGSMGESWSDLDALELLHELGYAGSRGQNPDSVGAYVTGNNSRGIRDYALNHNPLNYGDFGFDTTGPEVHADGEIWNGIQWHVRSALIKRYNHRRPGAGDPYPASNRRLQRACATGAYPNGTPANGFRECPGNRHWIQYIYDSFLLEANGAPTMVDMKNLMLAASTLRIGHDRRTMGAAFAQRGLGANSHAKSSEDTDPRPGFASQVKRDNAQVRFMVRDAATHKPVKADVYVGRYEARATPLASTFHAKGHPGSTATMVHGHYAFLVQAAGYGEKRFTASYSAGKHYRTTFRVDKNFASKARGATISGPGVRLGDLIDDTEATDAGYDGTGTSSAIKGKAWTVKLAGRHRIRRVSVSAEHHPAGTASTDFQGRLLDLRSFDIQVSSNGGRSYHTVYRSPANFFPGRRPRPVAPDLILRTAHFKPVVADHVRLVIRSNQCTGYSGYRDTDSDPTNNADCRATSDAFQVTAAELQVFPR